MKSAIRWTLLAVFLGSLNAAAAAASADRGDEPPTQRVSFADLDLTRGPGVAALYARIRSAAQQVCGPVDARQLEALTSSHRCTEQAIARAVSDVNAPMLTGYYLAKINATIKIAQR
jgi:UrcA family protein